MFSRSFKAMAYKNNMLLLNSKVRFLFLGNFENQRLYFNFEQENKKNMSA